MRDNWTYKKLGEVCEILNGFAFKSGKYTEQGIRVLRITNVQKGFIVDNEPKYYPFDEEQNIKQYMLKENDLLMSLTGNVGRVGLLQKELLPAALNQRVACIRITFNDILLKYIFHFLNSDCFERDCIFNATGIAQKNMSTEWLKKYIIPLPPLSEQQSIVVELDKINELISQKKAQLKDLDALAQSIFYDMFGDPIENEKGWEVKKLGEVGEIVAGSTPSTSDADNWDGHINWVTPAELKEQLYYGETERKLTEKGAKGLTLMPVGTVLLSSRAPIGKLAITKVPMCCNQGFKNIICNKDTNNIFLYYYLSLTIEDVKALGRGATFKEVSKTAISAYSVPLPPLSLQQEFAKRIELIELQKAQICSTIKDLETLLASRMQYWFD